MKHRVLRIAPAVVLVLSTSLLAASQDETERNAFTCRISTATLQPPGERPPTLERADREYRNQGPARELAPACREGEVPVAAIRSTRHFPKGNPLFGPDATPGVGHALPRESVRRSVLPFDQVYAEAGSAGQRPAPRSAGNASPICYNDPDYVACYYYAAAAEQRIVDGGGMTLDIESPAVDTGGAANGHSIGQIAVSTYGTGGVNLDDVEMGFSVSSGQWGNNNPHLFVYHFIGAEESCYDSCDWNQYSSTYYPGMDLSPLLGARVYIGWVHYQGAWWAWFNHQWMGYINDSVWANAFTQAEVIQWFGEVAEIGDILPYTQMGNGQFAESAASATMADLCNVNANAWVCDYGNLKIGTSATEVGYYDIVLETRLGGVRYGGPGASGP
jgi:hypothetical protein